MWICFCTFAGVVEAFDKFSFKSIRIKIDEYLHFESQIVIQMYCYYYYASNVRQNGASVCHSNVVLLCFNSNAKQMKIGIE